jgi:hypothetical protein
MRQFVDGIELLSGSVTYLPIDANGKTAIGARQDPRSWFNGAIRMVKITKRALSPSEFSLPIKTKVQDVGALPINNRLIQNYPNPFNPVTNFNYQIKSEGLVSIKIYNIFGQEVTTLVNEAKPAGTYTTLWNASAFGSGVYLCKMESNTYISTMKLVLLK